MDLPVQSIESLQAAGHAAAVKGNGASANPFPRHSRHHQEWESGHDWAVIAMVDQRGESD